MLRVVSTGRVSALGASLLFPKLWWQVSSQVAAPVLGKQRQRSLMGHGVPSTRTQLCRKEQVSSTQNAPPRRPAPLSAPSALHIMLCVSFEENKFCFSSADEGIRDLQKVFGKGKGSTVRTSRKMVPTFISDLTIFTIASSGIHLFTDNKPSYHITKATLGSVCDP